MRSVERITNIAAENIKNSVLKHLNFSDFGKNIPRESNVRIKRNSNYNLTEAEVRNELMLKNEAKKRKLDELNFKKSEKEKRKLAKESRLHDINNTMDDAMQIGVRDEVSNDTSLEMKHCYNCKLAWSSCTNQLHWRVCESCNNWCCFFCVQI